MDKQKILIVDDSEMNRDLLVEILKNQYDIVEANNGAEELQFFHSKEKTFHYYC